MKSKNLGKNFHIKQWSGCSSFKDLFLTLNRKKNFRITSMNFLISHTIPNTSFHSYHEKGPRNLSQNLDLCLTFAPKFPPLFAHEISKIRDQSFLQLMKQMCSLIHNLDLPVLWCASWKKSNSALALLFVSALLH